MAAKMGESEIIVFSFFILLDSSARLEKNALYYSERICSLCVLYLILYYRKIRLIKGRIFCFLRSEHSRFFTQLHIWIFVAVIAYEPRKE